MFESLLLPLHTQNEVDYVILTGTGREEGMRGRKEQRNAGREDEMEGRREIG